MLVWSLSSIGGQTAINLVMFSWVCCFPPVPHRACLVVRCPSKILLRNTTSTLSIKKGGAPVRGLRSKSRPFVVAVELAIPIFRYDGFLPTLHTGGTESVSGELDAARIPGDTPS
jgi:hypothetical protein